MAGHLSTSEPPDEHYSDLLFSYSIAYDIQVSSVFLVDCQKKKKQSGFSSTGELKGPVLFPGEIDITSVPCRVYRRAVNERLKNAGYKGGLYLVNPKYPEMHGLKCYPAAAAIKRAAQRRPTEPRLTVPQRLFKMLSCQSKNPRPL